MAFNHGTWLKESGKCQNLLSLMMPESKIESKIAEKLDLRILHSRPCCELKDLEHNVNSSGNLPNKEQNV